MTKLPKFRRAAQVLFFGLFMLHLLETEFGGSLRAAASDIRLPIPYPGIFLNSDPLVAMINILGSRSLYSRLLWSLTILIPTLFLGRFFCGWICPLGTLNHFFSDMKSETKRGARLIESNRYQKWQTIKYYLLATLLASSVFGVMTLAVLDPISFLIRSLAVSVLPAINIASNSLLDVLYRTNSGFLAGLGHFLQLALGVTVLSFRQAHFRQAALFGIVLITVMALNLRITRFWCRALCPLGALLGIFSRWSILGLQKDESACDDCNRCLLHCQGGDDPIPGANWRKAECHLCFNCVGDCPKSGLQFRFFPGGGPGILHVLSQRAQEHGQDGHATATTLIGPQLQRRKLLTSAAAGVALFPVLRSATAFSSERNPRLIRPPGALDESNFLARCVRCGECMKVCPSNALHPTLIEAGLEGIWSPALVPRIGYCEPSCTLCGQVCPTGAIWEITQAEKAWLPASAKPGAKPIRIGTAFYEQGRCLPWSMATDCIVCEEWCPTSPKAIYLVAAQVVDATGATKQVRQPHIDPGRCVGCGACEFACPVKDRPAVYVTSIGESRSAANQLLLRRAAQGS